MTSFCCGVYIVKKIESLSRRGGGLSLQQLIVRMQILPLAVSAFAVSHSVLPAQMVAAQAHGALPAPAWLAVYDVNAAQGAIADAFAAARA